MSNSKLPFVKNPKSRDRELVLQEAEKELLIYDLNINKAFVLNETSAIIWRMCDGKTSVKQMSEQLAEQQKKPVGEEIVWLALDNFKRNNLLAENEQVKTEFGGLSRREVIRKVGLASMIALPIVSSIVAPTAAMAATCGTTTPVASGCPVGVGLLQNPGLCTDTTGTDNTCNNFYGSGGFLSPKCVGNAVTRSCSPTSVAGVRNFTCECA